MPKTVTVGDVVELLENASESLRYAARRTRDLEKRASAAEERVRSAPLAQGLVDSGYARSQQEAEGLLKKLAQMKPTDVVELLTTTSAGVSMFAAEELDAAGGPTDQPKRLLTPHDALAYLRKEG